jgi:ribosomal peptide maturation radical SAM protein 1
MNFRKKSAPRVYEEIIEMSNRYHCLNFNMVDNILDMGYFKDLLPSLAAADLDLTLFYEVKANMTRDQVGLLGSAGITLLQPGIESLSTDLLRLMRKGITAIQNVQFLKWCAEFGLKPFWNLLYGFPGEDPSFYQDYPRLLPLLFHLTPPAGVFPISFERFSPYHYDQDKFNLKIKASFIYAMLYPGSKMDFDKVAYYFDAVWDGKDKSEHEFIALAKTICTEWKNQRQASAINFFYEKGQRFLTLYDSRPLGGQARPTLRRYTLDDVQSRIFLFCDENRSFNAIQQMLMTEVKTPPVEQDTRKLLDRFVAKGFMFREGDRYLSLATRKAHHQNHTIFTDETIT